MVHKARLTPCVFLGTLACNCKELLYTFYVLNIHSNHPGLINYTCYMYIVVIVKCVDKSFMGFKIIKRAIKVRFDFQTTLCISKEWNLLF